MDHIKYTRRQIINVQNQKKKIQKNCLRNCGWAVKKWSKMHFLSFLFFARFGHQRQKRCARGKLVGVVKEKNEKSYKMKV